MPYQIRTLPDEISALKGNKLVLLKHNLIALPAQHKNQANQSRYKLGQTESHHSKDSQTRRSVKIILNGTL